MPATAPMRILTSMSEHTTPMPTPQGRVRKWGAVALLVTLMLILMLGALSVIRDKAYYTSLASHCGHNISQLMGACVAYSQQCETAWPQAPLLWGNPGEPIARNPHEARVATIRNLEVLAQVQNLPNSLFHCPFSPTHAPTTKPYPSADARGTWGDGSAGAVSYAFDWSSPGDPEAQRVIFADRDPTYHRGHAMLCLGDSHVTSVKTIPRGAAASTGMVTEGSDGKPVGVIANCPQGQESQESTMLNDIYEAAPDTSGAGRTMGASSAARAWVK